MRKIEVIFLVLLLTATTFAQEPTEAELAITPMDLWNQYSWLLPWALVFIVLVVIVWRVLVHYANPDKDDSKKPGVKPDVDGELQGLVIGGVYRD